MRLKILRLAMQRKNYDLAAHAIVYGLIKATVQERQKNGQKGSTTRQPKRA